GVAEIVLSLWPVGAAEGALRPVLPAGHGQPGGRTEHDVDGAGVGGPNVLTGDADRHVGVAVAVVVADGDGRSVLVARADGVAVPVPDLAPRRAEPAARPVDDVDRT